MAYCVQTPPMIAAILFVGAICGLVIAQNEGIHFYVVITLKKKYFVKIKD